MANEERKKLLTGLDDEKLRQELQLEPIQDLDLKAVTPLIDEISSWDTKSLRYAFTIGDGYIDSKGALTIEHGWRERAYVQFKHHILRKANLLAPTSKITRTLRFTKNESVSWRFNTRALLKEERKEFYPEDGERNARGNPKKTIPTGLLQGLTPGILAFWYMDNGSRENSPLGMSLDVSAFSEIKQRLLKEAIENKFDIDTSFHDREQENNKKLNFKRRNIENLITQIRPFFIPNFLYKLPNLPV